MRFYSKRGTPTKERILARIRIDPSNQCWNWIGALDDKGYGLLSVNGKTQRAYRTLYQEMVGIVPKGLTLDHLCRNRLCVNPVHLEVVTYQTNILRGNGLAAQEAKRTHCPRGHEYTEENTHYGKTRQGIGRWCRQCDKERSRLRPERLNLKHTKFTQSWYIERVAP